jgi:heat shock protein HtpX
MNIYEQISSNKHWTWLVVILFIFIFLFIGMGFDYYYGARMPFFSVLALLVGSISAYTGYRYGDKIVLSSTRAKPLDLNDPKQRQWQNIVEEVSIASGLPLPKTYIIEDPDPNAFATGRNPQNSSIAVTRGLLNALNREELTGVAAHEMSHVKNFDIRLMLILAVLVGSIALLADWAMRSLFFRRSSRNREGGGGGEIIILVVWLVAVILAPILTQLMAMFVSRKREYLADASGAEITRNPLALASALEKIASFTGPTRSINRGTAHLCIEDPTGRRINFREGPVADLFATHPPVQKRIEALKQMAYLQK